MPCPAQRIATAGETAGAQVRLRLVEETPPGCTDPLKFADGNPYGVSHVTGGGNDAPLTDVEFAALDHLATRVITIAGL